MKMFLRVFSILTVLTLAACGGGGGDAGTSPFGSGSGTGTGTGSGSGTPGTTAAGPSVSLAVSSTTVTAQSPATVTVTVRDGSGNPLSGIVVDLKTNRSGIGQLNAASVLTDSAGIGTVGLQAATTAAAGADEVVGTATLGTTTVSGKVGFSVTGASATLSASVSTTTLRASAGAATFTAVVRDASGAALAGQIVNFASGSGRITLGTGSALTDNNGQASTTAVPADGSVGVADSLIASASVNGRAVQSAINVQVVPETPTVQVNLSNPTASSVAPVTVTAQVRDSANNPVANAVVAFSTQFGLGNFTAPTAVTGATGVATIVVSPRQATTVGADFVVASATVAGVTRTAQSVIQFAGSAATGTPTLQVSLSSNSLSSGADVDVMATLRDGSGSAIPNTVVSLSTVRSNLSSLAASTVLTNTQGIATTKLRWGASGVEGADEVVGVATVSGTQVQGRAGFSVVQPTNNIALTPSAAELSVSTPVLTFTATVTRADGSFIANQLVNFATSNSLVRLGAASGLTNASGQASVSGVPVSFSASGGDVVTASTSVDGNLLQKTSAVRVVSQAPKFDTPTINPSSSITSTVPGTLRVVARDANDNKLQGAVVTFSNQSNLTSFTPSSQVTDVNGEATTVVSPRLSTSNGADTVTASLTANGVTVTTQQVVQVASSTPVGTPTLNLTLSTTSISAASPATVTATLLDALGNGVSSQVVSFSVVRGLAATNVATALTDPNGVARVVLSPTNSTAAGADEISATVNYAGNALQKTQGFAVQASAVTLDGLVAGANPVSAYGQTNITLSLTGASVTSPVNIAVSSACVTQGKATLSPSSFTATTSTITMQYRDNGCGAVQRFDQLQAVVTSTGTSRTLSLGIQPPSESSIAFVSASPEQIYLRSSGFAETSLLTFEVRDTAGNPLPNKPVQLTLQTGAGGVTMQGQVVGVPISLDSNAQGRVSVRVNSGSLPTPVRVKAELAGVTPAIATVSSNLSVAVGLPSQLNFSFSQGTRNIEGYNIDGTTNTYQIIAADRSGNPVPTGTSINFVSEGGQIEAIRQTQIVNGIARTVANFVSAEPRPVDGRVTVTTYALGEESFIDRNGDNAYTAGEPFQDLGNVFKDRFFDGVYDGTTDEYIPLTVNNTSACIIPTNPLLFLDASIPSVSGNTCDAVWSGAGQVYVRRALETVLSTSTARPLWASNAGLSASCQKITLQVGPLPSNTAQFNLVAGDVYYGGITGNLNFIVADANPGSAAAGLLPRLNPMAAGSTITATTPTSGLTVTVNGGSPVPSTSEATIASIGYNFTDPAVNTGTVFVNFRSPSGLITTTGVTVSRAAAPSACP